MLKDFFISLLLSGTVSGSVDTAPYWATAGQYDVVPRSTGASGLLQMGMGYDLGKTFQWHWGASLGVRTDYFNKAQFLPDEAYAGIKWKCLTLDVGFKRKEGDFLAAGEELGSISTTAGNVMRSGNARTVPGYTFEVKPWAIPGLDGRLRLMGRFGDYWTIDNRYVKNALIHNTAFGISGDVTKWWTITLALDHYAMWGGLHPEYGKMSTSFSNYLRMLVGAPAAGGGYTESDAINVIGNQLGHELIRFDFRGNGWKIVFQHDIPYEDKSGMKFQNFPDGVNTLCFSFDDKNRWVSSILYEFHYTMWQSGTRERRPATEEEIAAQTNPRLYQEEDGTWSIVEGGGDDYFKDPSSNPETIQFLVSLRDQGIFSKGQDRWIDRGLDSKENFYYRGGFCDVVRALDFVCTLEKADTSRIYCFGQSQGGALTLIAGSLDHRMKLLAPSVPFLNDWKDYAKIVEWPVWEMMEAAEIQGIDKEVMFEMLRYFDVKNFTDRITCPVLMAFGLQDPICPPHTNFAAYNQIKAPKEYMCLYTCGHEAHTFINWLEKRSLFLNGSVK